MIKLTATALAFTVAWSVGSIPLASAAEFGEVRETCAGWEKVGRAIMRARQAGVPMSKSMEGATNSVMERTVLSAYEEPRFDTERMQQRAIADFGNETYLRCYRTLTQ